MARSSSGVVADVPVSACRRQRGHSGSGRLRGRGARRQGWRRGGRRGGVWMAASSGSASARGTYTASSVHNQLRGGTLPSGHVERREHAHVPARPARRWHRGGCAAAWRGATARRPWVARAPAGEEDDVRIGLLHLGAVDAPVAKAAGGAGRRAHRRRRPGAGRRPRGRRPDFVRAQAGVDGDEHAAQGGDRHRQRDGVEARLAAARRRGSRG